MQNHNHPLHPTPSLTGRARSSEEAPSVLLCLGRGALPSATRGLAGVGPLLLHNLKIAYRNLMKYKFQTLVSVLALAVGMVTLVATHFVLSHYAPPAVCDEPYYDRLYEMSFVRSATEEQVADEVPNYQNRITINDEIHAALTSGGGMAGVEKLFYADGYYLVQKVTLILADSTERSMDLAHCNTLPEYLNFRGIRSALTGEKIPVLNYGEAVLSETQAKRICGDDNPIGTKIVVREMGADYLSHFATYTVRDVYRTLRQTDVTTAQTYLCGDWKDVSFEWKATDTDYEILLQEGYSAKELEAEANRRLAPLGLLAKVTLLDDVLKEHNRELMLMRTIVYLISSMVLLAALVGFLKMQIQLFQMRRREVALRTVHGASGKSLYVLFLTEVMITLTSSLVLALVLASWLANYSEPYLNDMFNAWGWVVQGHHTTILCVFGIVVLLCAFIVWITLHRIRKTNRGLAAGMHRNARHTLRNTMLGIQLVVCIVFLAGSLAFSQFIGLIKEQMNIPDNDDHYAECIQINPFSSEDGKALEEYLQTNPKHITRAIKNNEIFNTFQEYMETPGAKEALNRKNFLMHYLTDTAYFDFWQRPIKWFVPKEQRQECILLSEKLYAELDSLGVIKSGALTPKYSATLPIGGTYATLPYKNEIKDYVKWECAVMQECPENFSVEYIIEPEEGKYHEAMEQMKEVMHRINPLPLEPTVFNLRERYTQELSALENFQRGAWILSAICALICFMGIWSTIALDTRSRQKEVALRKVHGAKRGDIALLFGRLYLWLIGVASAITMPVGILFNQFLQDWARQEFISPHLLSPVMPLALSISITSIVILLVVSLHVRKVMKQKPAEIIAKE